MIYTLRPDSENVEGKVIERDVDWRGTQLENSLKNYAEVSIGLIGAPIVRTKVKCLEKQQ